MPPVPPTSVEELLSRRLIVKATTKDDAAERYFCHRSRRTLWVEPEDPKDRSVDGAPRFLVDNGDGSRTHYSGEKISQAIECLVTFNKFAKSVPEEDDERDSVGR